MEELGVLEVFADGVVVNNHVGHRTYMIWFLRRIREERMNNRITRRLRERYLTRRSLLTQRHLTILMYSAKNLHILPTIHQLLMHIMRHNISQPGPSLLLLISQHLQLRTNILRLSRRPVVIFLANNVKCICHFLVYAGCGETVVVAL